MSMLQYDPVLCSEFLDRLHLGADVDWTSVHDAIQSMLDRLDVAIRAAGIRAHRQSSRVASPAFALYSYRAFDPPAGTCIDPVVVGVMFKQQDDRVSARGTIVGEEIGDLLVDVGTSESEADTEDVVQMGRELARRLLSYDSKIVSALRDEQRRAD